MDDLVPETLTPPYLTFLVVIHYYVVFYEHKSITSMASAFRLAVRLCMFLRSASLLAVEPISTESEGVRLSILTSGSYSQARDA